MTVTAATKMFAMPADSSTPDRVNLYSDTQTQPTPAMRQAMAEAPVGDEQRGEDPTVNQLCERVAELLGKEAALYLPSGAMCNLIALKTHTQPGDAVICERESHIIRAECGGLGVACGIVVDPIDSTDGRFTAEQMLERVRHLSLGVYAPPARLVSVENTHNFAGGTIWPKAQLDRVCDAAKEHGLSTHLDGARLLNASVAIGETPADLCRGFDSVWIDFSKGLGAPVGAALAGSRAFIDKARRYKHLFGGAMRQAGIIAAGALHAIEHHIDRLAEDHANAERFAEGLLDLGGVELVGGRMPQTNIVFFRLTKPGLDAQTFVGDMKRQGVDLSLLHGRIRAVTHMDVNAAAIDRALRAAKLCLSDAA